MNEVKETFERAVVLSQAFGPGLVLIESTPFRRPYARQAKRHLLDAGKLPASYVFGLLALHSSPNTVSTSALVGSVSTLFEMAKAVRNRSYVMMAASTSSAGTPSASICTNRLSKASPVSKVVIPGFSLIEVFTHNDTAAALIDEGQAHGNALMLRPGPSSTVWDIADTARRADLRRIVDSWDGQLAVHSALHVQHADAAARNAYDPEEVMA